MKIGEFAKACGIPISMLRYYDKCELLCPVYTNEFTRYRYYGKEQLATYRRIEELKAAGFSLEEIKKLFTADSGEREQMYEKKRKMLTEMLKKLEALQETMIGADFMNISEEIILKENINLPFENDEEVIGKWEMLETNEEYVELGGKKRELYFLPNGERYWVFGWTKGKLLFKNGVYSSANDYTLERRNGELFMTLELKTYDYPKSGTTEKITLRRVDNTKYTKEEITRKDNVDLPFVSDEQVLGHWVAFSFLRSREDFDPNIPSQSQRLFFKEITFFENGSCTGAYGSENVKSSAQTWTKGYVLNKFDKTACAYEIERSGESEYLIIEWKSGDYVWGGYDPNFYVFTRG